MFAASIFTTANTNALAAVPLFILMGDILFRSGAMEVLFNSLDRLIGRIRGRQYVLCILLSAILGALSGAAMAVAGMLGRSLFPSMIRRGYDTHLSVGTILGGASLDPIIPPSVLAIIIATLAQISTGKLLVAGIIPGLLLTGMFLIYVAIRVWAKPSLAPDIAADLADRKTQGSALMAVVRMVPSAFIFFLVMGLVLLGIATPDGSGGNRRIRRGRARGLLPRIVLEHADRGISIRGDGVLVAASGDVLRRHVQPAPDLCGRAARLGGDRCRNGAIPHRSWSLRCWRFHSCCSCFSTRSR